MYLNVHQQWVCPCCNSKGVITGRSMGNVDWAECAAKGTALDPAGTRNHQERIRAQREGKPPQLRPEPAMD